jgi:putative tryptophan/tyrosine transport system substrate-binding protein
VLIRRRDLIAMIGGAAVAWRRVAGAQAERVARVGYITMAGKDADPAIAPFRDRLRELGFTDGENLTIEARFAW